MSQYLAKYIGKKILGETVTNNFGTEDPYFETVPATRLNGKPSKKTRKIRKALPAGLSEHDGKVLTKVKRRAYRLDMSLFNCCGIRFGWGSAIGLVPGIGDVIDTFMALMVLRTCQQVEGGLPANVKAKMYFNIILDFGIGLVPILGDVADALFRANTRNAVVLEHYLREKGAMNLKAQGQRVPELDPSDPEEYDRHIVEQEGPPPRYTNAPPTGQGTHPQSQGNSHGRSTYPAQSTEGKGGGWFSGFGSKNKQQDVERGDSRVRRREDGPVPMLPTRPDNNAARKQSTLQKNRN